MMGDDRPPVYLEYKEGEQGWKDHQHILIIRASAIGHPCLWELIAHGQGEMPLPNPAVLQRAFDEGNLLEPVIIKRLEREYGVVFSSHQSERELWLSDDVAIRYHADGVGKYEDEWFVVEIKALSDQLWQTAAKGLVGDVIDEYNWQLGSMMVAENLPGLWVAYNKGLPPDDQGNRQPCKDMGKMLLQPVRKPPVDLVELQLKASLIKEGVYGEPILSSERPCDRPDHWPCRYLHIRPQTEDSETTTRKVLTPIDLQEVDRLVAEYLSYKGSEEESKAGKERARDKLLELAGDEYGYIQTDKFWIPIVEGTSVRTNTKAMSKELKQAIEKYKTRRKYKYIMNIRRLGL